MTYRSKIFPEVGSSQPPSSGLLAKYRAALIRSCQQCAHFNCSLIQFHAHEHAFCDSWRNRICSGGCTSGSAVRCSWLHMEHQSQRLGALRRRSLYRARLGRLAGLGLRPYRSLSAACCDCPHHTSFHPSHHRYRALTRSADHSSVAVLGGAVSGCAVCRAYCNPSRSAIAPNRMSLAPMPCNESPTGRRFFRG